MALVTQLLNKAGDSGIVASGTEKHKERNPNCQGTTGIGVRGTGGRDYSVQRRDSKVRDVPCYPGPSV